MRRTRPASLLLALLSAGCVTGPLFDNPMRLEGESGSCDNPLTVCTGQSGKEAYAEIFDRVLDVVDDHFPIAYSNRYEGRILGKPTIAPGYEQPWKPGSPDIGQRTLASLQAYRYRCEVRIREAEPSSYFVQVTILRELKDYPSTSGPQANLAVFGDAGTVDRDDFVIVDPTLTQPILDPTERYIPKGRDIAFEQALLRKIQCCQ